MRRISGMLAVAGLLLGFSSHATEDYVHAASGVALPAELLGFVRGTIDDYEASNPGQGVSIHYRKPGEHQATLTIFNNGLKPFPTSVDDPVIAEMRKLTVDVIVARAKTREPLLLSANSRHTGSATWETPGPRKTTVLVDMFIVYIGGRATNDILHMWLARGHIWKLRATREGEPAETSVAFAKAIAALSLAEPAAAVTTVQLGRSGSDVELHSLQQLSLRSSHVDQPASGRIGWK